MKFLLFSFVFHQPHYWVTVSDEGWEKNSWHSWEQLLFEISDLAFITFPLWGYVFLPLGCGKQYSKVFKSVGSRNIDNGIWISAVPFTSWYLIYLNLSFLICKIVIKIKPTSRCEDSMSTWYIVNGQWIFSDLRPSGVLVLWMPSIMSISNGKQ